jgi:DNA-binding transcriptional ArsR family regulator
MRSGSPGLGRAGKAGGLDSAHNISIFVEIWKNQMAQDNRLDIFRLLVQAGPDGLAAGRAAEELDLAPNKLTFHFDRLRAAGLMTVHREGRSMIPRGNEQLGRVPHPKLLPRCAMRRQRQARCANCA